MRTIFGLELGGRGALGRCGGNGLRRVSSPAVRLLSVISVALVRVQAELALHRGYVRNGSCRGCLSRKEAAEISNCNSRNHANICLLWKIAVLSLYTAVLKLNDTRS
jgi:hypothetical protein